MSDTPVDVRIWVVPVAACVAAGVVGWATVGWRIGIVPIAVAATTSAVLYASRHHGVQAWRVHYENPQRRTAVLLRSAQRSGHRVLHSCTLPDGGELDHLVVGPHGVHAVQSRRFHRRIPMRTMHRDLFHGPNSQGPLLDHASRQAEQAASSLGGVLRQPVHVTPTVVVHGAEVPWKVLTLHGVDVISGSRLRRYINRPEAGARRDLSSVEVERIVVAAETTLPPRAEELVGKHLGRRAAGPPGSRG